MPLFSIHVGLQDTHPQISLYISSLVIRLLRSVTVTIYPSLSFVFYRLSLSYA